ncbi:hypothetical protein CN080_35140, partial [Sinorhizobium meliloti]
MGRALRPQPPISLFENISSPAFIPTENMPEWIKAYATSTPHRFFSCSDLRLIYGPSNELTEEYLTS